MGIKGKTEYVRLQKINILNACFLNLSLAWRTEARDMSIEMIDASGLFRDRVKVCAPTPQPASRTRLPAG